jgi:hypothetical protein
VRDARGKLRGLRLAGVERAAKHQSNLVASLLTIGMSNICHPNHDLRVVAMELLEALCVELKVEEAMEIATRGWSIRIFYSRLELTSHSECPI